MANTLNLGNGEWALKENSLLAYNSENDNFKPLPFDFTRASNATRVNKLGLIETVSSGQPRIDFLGNTNGSLLLEPQRTNLLFNSDNGSTYSVFSATKTLNEVISLDGTLNSFTLEGNGDYNQVLGYTAEKTLSVGDYAFSVFAKKGNNNFIQLFFDGFSGSLNGQAYFDLENGTSSSLGQIENYGNGWYKCSVIGTVVGGDLTGRFGFRISYSSSNFFFPNENDANGKNAYFYGFQLEQGSYPTSYIKTEGSAVTRVVDKCISAGNNQVIKSTEGTIYAEQKSLETNFTYNYFVAVSDGTNNNRLEIRQAGTGLQFLWRVGGVYQSAMPLTNAPFTSVIKYALRYSSTDIKFYVNGSLVGTINSPTLYASGTLDNIEFADGSGGTNFRGIVKECKYYNTALTDSECIALTQV